MSTAWKVKNKKKKTGRLLKESRTLPIPVPSPFGTRLCSSLREGWALLLLDSGRGRVTCCGQWNGEPMGRKQRLECPSELAFSYRSWEPWGSHHQEAQASLPEDEMHGPILPPCLLTASQLPDSHSPQRGRL